VVNARDAMPAGGVLTVATRSMDDAAAIDVRDSGIGISADVHAGELRKICAAPRRFGAGTAPAAC